MNAPLLIPARKAAEISGYVTERRFRLAVDRGKMPKPYDAAARPQLWSLDEINARLGLAPIMDKDARAIRELEQRLGIPKATM